LLDLCLVAASDNYRELPPLDRIPCWTTVVHREPGVRPRRHGGDLRGLGHAVGGSVGRCPVTLANLGVCLSSESRRSCGRIRWKYADTMIELELAGKLGCCAEALKGPRRASALVNTTTDAIDHTHDLAASGVDEQKGEG
jgi:hypothetical protein